MRADLAGGAIAYFVLQNRTRRTKAVSTTVGVMEESEALRDLPAGPSEDVESMPEDRATGESSSSDRATSLKSAASVATESRAGMRNDWRSGSGPGENSASNRAGEVIPQANSCQRCCDGTEHRHGVYSRRRRSALKRSMHCDNDKVASVHFVDICDTVRRQTREKLKLNKKRAKRA